jgi:hypothetical protein
MKYLNKYGYYVFVFIIIIVSFLFYSSNFYPLLSSDDALNILMAHYYKLPNDIYCWGQDRGGTLIPLISQIFIKIFHFSAVTSVSFSNYLILIIGFIGFSSLLKTKYNKILFAIIWFLPFQRFIDILRFPIGVEYSLIAASIFLINRLDFKSASNRETNNITLAVITLIFIISIWVSDLAIITIGTLLVVLLIFSYFERNAIVLNKSILYSLVFGLTACFLFIKFAKSFAIVKSEHYLSINDMNSFKEAALLVVRANMEVLAFKTNEIFVTFYSYLVILFLIVFISYLFLKNKFLILFSNKWFAFFVLDFCIIFAALLFSSWVSANNMGRWYFVASYISLSLAILIAIETMDSFKYPTKYLRHILLIIVLIGAISPIYTMKYVGPKTLRPMIKVVSEFKQLGKIGVIAEFWNSYITSCPDPEMIKATPHDKSDVRNQKLVDMVFEQKNLYIIKDMWMKTFPDTIEQFGYVLLRDGNQFRLGGCEVCKYKKIKLQKEIQIDKFKYTKSQMIYDNLLGRNVLYISSGSDTCNNRYFIYGPYIPVGIGEFCARFYLKAKNITSDTSFAILDVAGDWGAVQLAKMNIAKADFSNSRYNYIDLDFKTSKRFTNIEFRIYYYGHADIYFDHLELKEK